MTSALEEGQLSSNPCRIRGAGGSRPATPTTVATPTHVVELAAQMPERVTITRGGTGVNGTPHVGPPKTDAGVRAVSVPPHIATAITDHQRTHTGPGPGALLFPAEPQGATQMNPSTFAYHLETAVGRTSLPPTFRFHWLRHTGLTLAAQSGATIAELQARAGHSTASTVMLFQHATTVGDETWPTSCPPWPARRQSRPRLRLSSDPYRVRDRSGTRQRGRVSVQVSRRRHAGGHRE